MNYTQPIPLFEIPSVQIIIFDPGLPFIARANADISPGPNAVAPPVWIFPKVFNSCYAEDFTGRLKYN